MRASAMEILETAMEEGAITPVTGVARVAQLDATRMPEGANYDGWLTRLVEAEGGFFRPLSRMASELVLDGERVAFIEKSTYGGIAFCDVHWVHHRAPSKTAEPCHHDTP